MVERCQWDWEKSVPLARCSFLLGSSGKPLPGWSSGGCEGQRSVGVKGSSVWTWWPGATPQQPGHVQHHCSGCWGTKRVFTCLGFPSFTQFSLLVPLGPKQDTENKDLNPNLKVELLFLWLLLGSYVDMRGAFSIMLMQSPAFWCLFVGKKTDNKRSLCLDWKLILRIRTDSLYISSGDGKNSDLILLVLCIMFWCNTPRTDSGNFLEPLRAKDQDWENNNQRGKYTSSS